MFRRTDEAWGRSLGGGAIAVATLEMLMSKGLLNVEDAQYILNSALHMLSGPIIRTSEGVEAHHHITALMAGTFSEQQWRDVKPPR